MPDANILRFILSAIDLTSLEGADTEEKITRLCHTALDLAEKGLPAPAAVCVYPVFIPVVKKILSGSGIRVATVAGAFPSGQMPADIKEREVHYAALQGADEIDVVISRRYIIGGRDDEAFRELAAIREATRGLILKVILETGELKTTELIRSAANTAIRAGADFIKTSTGKVSPGATPESLGVMLDTIRLHYQTTGKRIGIKAAGGISQPDTAIGFYHLIREKAGEEWLHPSLCRFGASSLLEKIRDYLFTFA